MKLYGVYGYYGYFIELDDEKGNITKIAESGNSRFETSSVLSLSEKSSLLSLEQIEKGVNQALYALSFDYGVHEDDVHVERENDDIEREKAKTLDDEIILINAWEQEHNDNQN